MGLLDSTFLPPLLSIYLLYLGAAMTPGPNLFVIEESPKRRDLATPQK